MHTSRFFRSQLSLAAAATKTNALDAYMSLMSRAEVFFSSARKVPSQGSLRRSMRRG
jgi:hypothetical protein